MFHPRGGCMSGVGSESLIEYQGQLRLRLTSGPSPCSGRVEVLINNTWSAVCDAGWGLPEAGVVCKQLGCGTALSAPGLAQFGHGAGDVWLEGVSCSGQESLISEPRPWGDNKCDQVEDAGVECSGKDWIRNVSPFGLFAGSAIPDPAPLRLVNGPNRCTGRVEVLHNQQWGTVCDDSWDLHDATVVCRQLGCGMALSAPGEAWFGQGSDNIWLDETNCTGTEAALSECRARPWGDNTCNHVEDAGVKCSEFFSPAFILFAGPADPGTAPIRLVNGPSRCAGRVEVFYNQHWRSICDDSWDLYDARVVCRQVGCGMPLSALVGARFGQGSNAIWLDDVHCIGTEVALSKCNIRPWGDHNCNHTQDASVVCSGKSH
uniref:SRCR domain-containing protein n=1 Tax=Gopherus evgoodei TaxID=1825980 RepID=A0A8C4YER2_9SAUR